MARHYGKYTPGRGESRQYSSGMAMQGMQSPDLVVGLDDPLWDTITAQEQQVEQQARDATVGIGEIFALEELGDQAAYQAVGGAFLRVAEQRGFAFGPELEHPER